MPWSVSDVMDQRVQFIEAYFSGLYTMTEACEAFGISRQNGYKWLHRFRMGGQADLQDRSRAPKQSPQRIESEVEALLIAARRTHPTWGPRKILPWLLRRDPSLEGRLPAASTIGDLFRREGLSRSRRRRGPRPFKVAGALQADLPNDVWTADFKGEFRLSSGPYCYPFTLVDAYSRYVLCCRAETSTALEGARRSLRDAFREFGLPWAIRTDNGTPFVGHGLSGLSTLSVWWIKLGIRHDRIPKGRPDQNGRHERMHRTLKAEATRPPGSSMAEQQRRFEAFLEEFNHERPHEALGQTTPACSYVASERHYPERMPGPEYPDHFEKRKVDRNGSFKFGDRRYFIAHPLAGETLGLVEIEHDLWSLRFYDYELGRINPSAGDFFVKVSPMSPV
jgi:putative transposase